MSSARRFIHDYYRRFSEVLERFDREPLELVAKALDDLRRRDGTLWVAGNGGSASISDHWVCDATKGTHVRGRATLRAVSLTSNVAMLTALGNDIGYEDIFRSQLEYYLRADDAVLLVSSSGNSPNVVSACRYANSRNVPTLAFVGFDGGELAREARFVVHVPVHNYGMAEDSHQSLMHCLTQYLRETAPRRTPVRAAGARKRRRAGARPPQPAA